MDGIAISFAAFQEGKRTFVIEGTQAAGMPPLQLQDPDNAIEVMTGAMLPEGTDTVIRYEDVEIRNSIAQLQINTIEASQNIHPKGQDCKKDALLLSGGLKISPAEISLLASIGKSQVGVFQFPKTAIISTGDELIDVDQEPLLWQIRKSNSFALQAAFRQMNLDADLFHISDDEVQLQNALRTIFKDYELIILSGGASKGKFDFVPKTLEQLGIKKLFHQISQRPGKPIWFGCDNAHTVFALPGNPVSTYMCFYRYIKPWLEKSLGLPEQKHQAVLAADFRFNPALTYFLQVKVANENGTLMAYPDPGGGSGDFANLKEVDGFLELPIEKSEFHTGEIYPYFPFRLY